MKKSVQGHVRGIYLDWSLSGTGGVNFDSSDQKYTWNQQDNVNRANPSQNNFTFHKGTYHRTEKGKLEKSISLSPEFLRHHIFEEEHAIQSSLIATNFDTFNQFVSTKSSIVRGYLVTDLKGQSFKRASSLSLPSAEQTSKDTISILAVSTKSGQKIQSKDREEGDDRKDTSLRYTETFGDITYKIKDIGFINLDELQFISADVKYDRQAISEDNFEQYKENVEKELGSKISDLMFYKKSGATLSCEKGIKLTNEQVMKIVKYTLKRILTFSVRKRSGSVQTASLKIGFVIDGDPMSRISPSDTEKFKVLDSIESIDALNIDLFDSYIESDKTSIAKFAEWEKEFKQNEVDKFIQKNKEKEEAAGKAGKKGAKGTGEKHGK